MRQGLRYRGLVVAVVVVWRVRGDCVALVDGSQKSAVRKRCGPASLYGRSERLGDILYVDPALALAGVRCCSDKGRGRSLCDGEHCKLFGFAEAVEKCARAALRLCTVKELLTDYSNITATGCGYDHAHVWSSERHACERTGEKFFLDDEADGDVVSSEEGAMVLSSSLQRKKKAAPKQCFKAVATHRLRRLFGQKEESSRGVSNVVSKKRCRFDVGQEATLEFEASEIKAGIRCCSSDPEERGRSYCKKGMCQLYSWFEAQTVCAGLGLRLCSAGEIKENRNRIAGTGCLYDGVPIWSHSQCDENPWQPPARLGPGRRPVDDWGKVKTHGRRLLNRHQEEVQLVGMSFFWSNKRWGGRHFYKAATLRTLVKDWGVTLTRVPMGVDTFGGLLHEKDNEHMMRLMVQAAIREGIYVIIDFHSYHAHKHEEAALMFFEKMAKDFGHFDNVIFEVYNEPSPRIPWRTIKAYAERIIERIRFFSENLIVVGTRSWCQNAYEASLDPITYDNIAYAVHFYAASPNHGLRIRDDTERAMDNGIAVFVTEWGSVEYTGDGNVDPQATQEWLAFLDRHKISWANWSLNDKNEGASALKLGASDTGPWTDQWLTPSGHIAKTVLQNHHTTSNTSLFGHQGPTPDAYHLSSLEEGQ